MRSLGNTQQIDAGFTLIEVLVVVAVTSMMLAVLLPVLHQARILGKRITCAGNLRQIGVAWHLYLDDYNGAFLKGPNMNKQFGGVKINDDETDERPLNRYLGQNTATDSSDHRSVFYCPGDTRANNTLGRIFFEDDGNSYQANSYLIGQDQLRETTELNHELNQRLPYLTLQAITANPSQLLLVGDTHWRSQWEPLPFELKVADWHRKPGFFNIVFLDGHTDFIRIKRGVYLSGDYSLIPFTELSELTRKEQQQWDSPSN